MSSPADFLGSRALTAVLWVGLVAVTLLMINLLASRYFVRIDLTEEKRYTLKPPTRTLLNELDETVYVEVFLDGKLNSAFTRLGAAIRETLDEFRIASGNRVQYTFTDPGQARDENARQEFFAELARKGVTPTRVIENVDGQRIEKIVFPGALLTVGGDEEAVVFLKGNKAAAPEMEINQSIEGIEFGLANAISRLTNLEPRRIAWITGHGELDGPEGASLEQALVKLYEVERASLDRELSGFHLALIAKPVRAFEAKEKFMLDQFIMNGGKALFLLDRLDASMDSASRPDYFAFPLNLNLDDLLFRYGVRLNMDLIQDRAAAFQPVVTGANGQMQLLEWPFFPLLNDFSDHPITRNLDAVIGKFVSSLDTVKAEGVRKTVLFKTSPYSRRLTAPVKISIDDVRRQMEESEYNQGPVPVAYLLEGTFTSLFKSRFVPEGVRTERTRETSLPTALVVISDGDLARNPVNLRSGNPQPLGFDPASNYTFANEELLLNTISYLLDGDGLISARSRQVRLRPLDKQQVIDEKALIRWINIGLPLLLLSSVGLLLTRLRKRRYTR